MSPEPKLPAWQDYLLEKAREAGQKIAVRRSRQGSLRWRFGDCKVEVDTYRATRRMERMVHGREHP
jgi:hypothetical protein